MSHSLILFMYHQVTLENWTHTNTTHLWLMLFPLPPRAATNFSSTAPGKCRLYSEKDNLTLITHTHTLLFLGRRLSLPWSCYSGVIVWTVIWGQEAVGWFAVLCKIHCASAPLISSSHNLKKWSLYNSNTCWWFIGMVFAICHTYPRYGVHIAWISRA